MMALALLQQLHELDVALEPHLDGTLRYRAPKGVLTPALLDVMRQHKPELHALVEEWSERAALMEYDGRLPRDEAERLAWVCIQSARDVCTV
jgi:TubC N-terminal docking domain